MTSNYAARRLGLRINDPHFYNNPNAKSLFKIFSESFGLYSGKEALVLVVSQDITFSRIARYPVFRENTRKRNLEDFFHVKRHLEVTTARDDNTDDTTPLSLKQKNAGRKILEFYRKHRPALEDYRRFLRTQEGQELTVIRKMILDFRKEKAYIPFLLLKIAEDEARTLLHILNESITSANALVTLYRSHLDSAVTSHSTFDGKQLEKLDENLENVLKRRDMLLFLKKDILQSAFGAFESMSEEELKGRIQEHMRAITDNCTLLDGWRKDLEELVDIEINIQWKAG